MDRSTNILYIPKSVRLASASDAMKRALSSSGLEMTLEVKFPVSAVHGRVVHADPHAVAHRSTARSGKSLW